MMECMVQKYVCGQCGFKYAVILGLVKFGEVWLDERTKSKTTKH